MYTPMTLLHRNVGIEAYEYLFYTLIKFMWSLYEVMKFPWDKFTLQEVFLVDNESVQQNFNCYWGF